MKVTIYKPRKCTVYYTVGAEPLFKEVWTTAEAVAWAQLVTAMGATNVHTITSDTPCAKCKIIHIGPCGLRIDHEEASKTAV